MCTVILREEIIKLKDAFDSFCEEAFCVSLAPFYDDVKRL